MPHHSDSTKALWREARDAYERLGAINLQSKDIAAKMRLVGAPSNTYNALHHEFNDLQIEWRQAFRLFSDAQSKFTAHMREMMFSAAKIRYLSEALAADVETGSKPGEVSLSFHTPMRLPVRIGPAPWFRITRNCVRQGPLGEPVGIYQNNAWRTDDESFMSYDVEGPAAIQLDDGEDHIEIFGPFDLIRMANAVLWAETEPLVKLSSATQLWQHVKTNMYWPEMIIKAP